MRIWNKTLKIVKRGACNILSCLRKMLKITSICFREPMFKTQNHKSKMWLVKVWKIAGDLEGNQRFRKSLIQFSSSSRQGILILLNLYGNGIDYLEFQYLNIRVGQWASSYTRPQTCQDQITHGPGYLVRPSRFSQGVYLEVVNHDEWAGTLLTGAVTWWRWGNIP